MHWLGVKISGDFIIIRPKLSGNNIIISRSEIPDGTTEDRDGTGWN